MDVMSIARLSTHMAESNLMREVGIRVMSNAMEQAELQAEMMATLMQSVNAVPVGFDGIGIQLDVMA